MRFAAKKIQGFLKTKWISRTYKKVLKATKIIQNHVRPFISKTGFLHKIV